MPTNLNRRNGQSIQTEISLIHLNNCLVNLPTSLCSLLANVNTLAQNVIVELSYRTHSSGANLSTDTSSKSVYVGWTGLQSRRKVTPIFNKESLGGTKTNLLKRDHEVPLVELDLTFARTLEIADGQKVTTSLHLEPPVAHTVNIEPLTIEDWEIIELHAKFLELNLISQIRALPNPGYALSNATKSNDHPLTLKLSPTSTANIRITALAPEPPSSSPFAKLDPNAEIIVAPKTRTKPTRLHGDNRSITSRKSASGRRKNTREECRQVLHFRGVEKQFCRDRFKDQKDAEDQRLRVWVDEEVCQSKYFKGVSWVSVTVLKPPSLQPSVDPQKQQQEADNLGKAHPIASKVIAQLVAWDDPPDCQHIALSKSVCVCLGCEGIVGGIVKLEPAIPPFSPASIENKSQQSKSGLIVIKIYPFSSRNKKAAEGLKFGGESKAEIEETTKNIKEAFGGQAKKDSLFGGPITDGMILGKSINSFSQSKWEGGILRFDHPPADTGRQPFHWFVGSEHKFLVESQPSVLRPSSISMGDPSLPKVPSLVGIDALIEKVQTNLLRLSSILLTGAQGSGKSSLAQLLSNRLKITNLFHTVYFSCRRISKNGLRVATIKETFNQLFLSASWGARLGGRSIIVLDDLDKLCPTETELETSENGRSRHISEGLCSIAKKYCTMDSGVVILATAQSKESLHNIIIGGHVFRETLALKTPNKLCRKTILEAVTMQALSALDSVIPLEPVYESNSNLVTTNTNANESTGSWMENCFGLNHEFPKKVDQDRGSFVVSPNLDFLDLAGETDGYMPGDLVLLVTRARSEAIIRAISQDSTSTNNTIPITSEDFSRAIKGFTPASLRNVTLQKCTTTFDCIGGLHATRRILLETLQYPTTYAPIFAQCPLRLRSGILLYGYPGCGKTLLASVVAGEFGLNFISVKGPEILNKYIGASEKSVRDLFERAEAAKPCVLFLDEFDSIAPKRGHDSTGVTDRVVNQILTQMDGAEGLSGVYVLAATSRPDLIDPALLRPGRLDKSLICDLPNEDDRIDILSTLGKKLKLSYEAQNNLAEIASHTDGYSGADLQALIYNAHLEAIHDLLGDQDVSSTGNKIGGNNEKALANSPKDFLQFRYGEEEEYLDVELARIGTNKSKIIAEKSAILRKLAEIQAQKQLIKKRMISNDMKEDITLKKRESEEVIIHWRHLAKSLSTTKASISIEERNRLAAIYREFLTARDGKIHSGEGGREVGGRVSLM